MRYVYFVFAIAALMLISGCVDNTMHVEKPAETKKNVSSQQTEPMSSGAISGQIKEKSEKQKVEESFKKIKGVWDPGFVERDVEHLSYLRSLGVNTISIPVGVNSNYKEYIALPGKGEVFGEEAVKVYEEIITKAKKQGFAVMVVLEYAYFTDASSVYPSKKFTSLEEFLSNFKKLARKWAEICEKLGVEYFSPINELDQVLLENGFRDEEILNIEKEFFSEVVPEVKKRFSNKVYCKTGSVHSRYVFPYEGCDILGTIVAPSLTKEFREQVSAYLANAQEWSRKTGKCWIVGEFFIPGADPAGYVIALEEINRTEVKPCGVVFMGPFNPSGGFRMNKQSEEIVRAYFTKGYVPKAEEEYDMKMTEMPKDVRTMKGPGGCKSKEECEAYCKEHPDECKEWCIKTGMCAEEEAEHSAYTQQN